MGETLPVVTSTSDDSQCNRSAAIAWNTEKEQGRIYTFAATSKETATGR